MKTKVRFFVRLQEITGEKEVDLKTRKGETVENVLERLSKRYGREFRRYIYADNQQIANHLQILVNGTNITNLQGLATKLEEGAQLDLVPLVAGG